MGRLMCFFSPLDRIKQGEPLSHMLFIMGEVLSRCLNNLFLDNNYAGYGLPKRNPEINHLAYADDTILFGFGINILLFR